MNNQPSLLLAPPLDTVEWINSSKPLTLAELKGKIVVIHAFQMLCPGCVAHGLPQAQAIYKLYREEDVQVIGLHTVFEHHEIMTSAALTAFSHEYQFPFPIAIDRPSDSGPIPHTMANYQMQGTPSLIILDKNGCIRMNHFGRISDMQVGSIIGGLLEEKSISTRAFEKPEPTYNVVLDGCREDGCLI